MRFQKQTSQTFNVSFKTQNTLCTYVLYPLGSWLLKQYFSNRFARSWLASFVDNRVYRGHARLVETSGVCHSAMKQRDLDSLVTLWSPTKDGRVLAEHIWGVQEVSVLWDASGIKFYCFQLSILKFLVFLVFKLYHLWPRIFLNMFPLVTKSLLILGKLSTKF